MNEAEEIKKLKSELEETRGDLLKAQFRIMDLECLLNSTGTKILEILNKER